MAEMRWSRSGVVGCLVILAGCTCDPRTERDAGSELQPIAWPPGARLRVTKTTIDSAELEWPPATGPVTAYRLSAGASTRDTTTTTAALTGLRLGQHVAVAVVAVAEDGTTTEPLHAEVAPAEPLAVADGDISTDFCGANAFLVRGVSIPCEELAVITGHVRTADGVGVPGLRVSVLKHPEWGETTTQADGLYALAVATGRHTLDLRATSFLPLQRQLTAPPHLFTVAPDTVVLRRDEKATTLSTATGGFHRATLKEDADGKRSTAVFIPAGTSASLELPDGGTQPTTTLTLRATEATVGPTGPEQMPATLPAATAYTFAADVTADEALAIGATGVTFASPVALYAENFLGYPVGAAVPLGVYDDTKGRWESGPNAAVLTVTEGGGVDYTGDGTADADFPLLAGEKEVLAANYSAGSQLIRSVTTHFSAFDTNPCWACLGSCEENGTSSAGDEPQCDTCPGSVLRMQNQTLSEFFPVSGSGLALGWHSNRFNVRSAGVNMALGLLADGGQPEGVRATFFRLDVAGKTIILENFDGGVGDAQRLAWDGKDVFGRTVKGPVPARASTGYGFGAISLAAASGGGGGGATGVVSFSAFSFGVWPPPGALQMASTREAAFFLKHFSHSLGDWVPRENLGNLTLNVVHGYSEDGTLHLGNGGIVTAAEGGAMLRYVAGGGTDTSEDGGLSSVSLSAAPVFAEGPDGLFFIERESRVRVLKNDGGVVTVAGDLNMGFAGDGAPARQGRFNYARLLEVDPDGNLFVGDIENFRIRRIDAVSGVLSTYVGNGQRGSSPDGTLATEARLDGLVEIRFAQDGHLYFMAADGQAGVLLRRVENGRVYTVAGGNCMASRPPWETRHPREVCFRGATHWLGEDREGRLYVAGMGSGEGTTAQVVRRIEADGRVTLLAGAGNSTNPEEPVARRTCFSGMTGLAVADDGTVYVGESGGTGCGLRGPGLRAISPEGDFSTFLGGVRGAVAGAKPTDGAAAATLLNGIGDVTRRRDGRILFLHRGPTTTLHEVVLPGPRVRRLVPSRDGNEVYSFDVRGRHLRTTSARTGVTLWEFAWGDTGLQSLKDVNGDVTTVERDASGRATALIAPDGQRTTLTLDAAGRATRLQDSEGRFVEAAYKDGTGLLSEWKDENGNPTRFEWDEAGNLLAHINAVGARKTWVKKDGAVVFTSPLGRQTTYGRQVQSDGALLTTTLPEGTVAVREYGSASRRTLSADGTTTLTRMQSGARFGRGVDVPGDVTVRTPSGLESRLVATRSSTTAPDDPLRVTEEVEELRVNGRLWRSRFDGTGRTYELVSPLGLRISAMLDERSRPLTVTAPGVLPVVFAYDPRGRVTSVTQGTRSLSYTYSPKGYLASMKDALNHETLLDTDSTGRVSKLTQADAKDVALTHDLAGNLTSVTPADRTAHRFEYSKVNEVTSYEPPQVPGVVAETSSYDLDGFVTKAGHSDGSETIISRDSAGRTTQVKTPWWTNDITYDPTTGQVTSLTRGTNRLEFKYDGFLVTEEKATGIAPATSQWTYDSDYRVASHTVNGVTINSTYDAEGRLIQRGPVSLAYNPTTGQLATVAVGVVTTTYTWNGYGEVSTINATANGAPVYSEAIQYDSAGRITAVDEVVQGTAISWVYGYDTMGRLTSASRNGAAASTWTYDGTGNRLSESGRPSTYDAQDRLNSRGSTSYAWDALRSRASKTENGTTTQYTHDGLGALRAVTVPSGAVVSYVYDGRQRRIARQVDGVVTDRWAYDGQYAISAAFDASGNVSRFVFGSQGHSPDAFSRSGATFAYVKNHLGSVRLVVNAANGDLRQSIETDPWGVRLAESNPSFQPFAFAAGVHDVSTGLTHFGFRDYDSSSALWTAPDPLRWGAGKYLSPEPLLQSPASVRRMAQSGISVPTYAYALNNPIRYIDSDGLKVTSDINRTDFWERFVDTKMTLMSCSAISQWFKDCFGTDPFTNSKEYTFIYDRSAADLGQSASTNWWTNNTTLGRSAFSVEKWSYNGNAELGATILHELTHHLQPIRTNDTIDYVAGGYAPSGACSASAAEKLARELWKKGCDAMCSGGAK